MSGHLAARPGLPEASLPEGTCLGGNREDPEQAVCEGTVAGLADKDVPNQKGRCQHVLTPRSVVKSPEMARLTEYSCLQSE